MFDACHLGMDCRDPENMDVFTVCLNRMYAFILFSHILVFWIPASSASSYLLAALPPSLAVVHAGMTY